MSKSTILKEKECCPFCASNDIKHEQDTQENGVEVWVCWCGNCGSFGPTDLGWSGAIAMWNLRRPRADLLDALKEIAKMEGPYSRDPLTHAENVIENLTNIANKAIAKAEGGE